ncbi:protoporphyrinogen oxidase [Roseovarius albus]|uniref:Tryptophan 2-monooxygenase n=1 Tax=Roseovarius albus TaxID=1247867 RepID=A0A1X6ZUD2_9RHOB|nr:FAD-dependent oxidoreductase [Roseovarius albus]SLN61266.1 protoporphyrinogen oxidase [Roseovarius albus]
MERRDFLAMAALLGFSTLATPNVLQASTSRRVIVIGAGAAGLTAGYCLRQRGMDFQILEASNTFGGRMKRNLGFADFPLPMGAEWLHVSPRIFKQIVGNRAVNVALPTVGYKRDDSFAHWDGNVLKRSRMGGETDRKFVNSSWLDFFEQYIFPAISDRIQFQNPVTVIDTSGARAFVQTRSGETFTADDIIVTAPLKMLQERRISFVPPLPRSKSNAINRAKVWDGYKAFLEFNASFYPAYTEVKVTPKSAGQLGFYDAAYGQNTQRHILGVFAVGSAAKPYLGLPEAATARKILGRLDEIFDRAATPKFRKIVTQDWSNEPFIGGAYLQDHENWKRVRQLGNPVGPHLHFAGEAYTDGEDWGSVHAAALAAKKVVDRM